MLGLKQRSTIPQSRSSGDVGASRFDYIESNGIRLNYEELGAGPVLLLVNYQMTDFQTLTDIRHHLLTKFRCIIVDLPGCGRTIAPDDYDFSPRSDSALIEDLLICLDITEFTIIDQGYGARLAVSAARKMHGTAPSVSAI